MSETPNTSQNAVAFAKKRQSLRKMAYDEKVELILPQEEDDKLGDSKKEEAELDQRSTVEIIQVPITSRRRTIKPELEAGFQTPRRSVRKSIKPPQDYEDIVAKKTSRSLKKDEKQFSVEDDDSEGVGSDEKSELAEIPDTPKWTPAKVGRGSEKRKKRRTRKTNGKQDNAEEQRIIVEEEILVAIEINEDENKENVSPQDLLKQRKLSKDNENLKTNPRRSQELVNSAEKKRQSLRDTVLKPLDLEHQEITLTREQVISVETKENDTDAEVQTVVNEKKEDDDKTKNENIVTEIVADLVHLSDDVAPIALGIALESKKTELLPELLQNSPINLKQIELNEVEVAENKDTTFNTSDCILISPETSTVNTNEAVLNIPSKESNPDDLMESLLVSDDSDTDSKSQKGEQTKISENLSPSARKIPKITITQDSFINNTLVTPTLQIPKQRSKPFRFPTPYKSREDKNFSFDLNKDFRDEDNDDQENSEPATVSAQPESNRFVKSATSIMKLTNLEPKEIILRSIRKKRSLSACTDHTPYKSMNRVKFHSPSNQTILIDDIDAIVTKSTIKKRVGTPVMRKKGELSALDSTNITKRRKRSLSFDESIMQMRLKPQAPNKLRASPQKLQRTKIPNFAAIHQRHFDNMENLADHVQRKAERAKILITSTSKIRTASAQKVGPPIRNQNIEPSFGSVAAGLNTVNKAVSKPKALKKIDLNDITVNNETPSKITNLPNPQLLYKNLAIVKPMPLGKKPQKPVVTSAKKVFKPAQEPQQKRLVTHPKPPFNLSTNVKACDTSSLFMFNAGQSTNTSIVNKVVTRRQRHMDMFKGRTRGRDLKDQENASEIIRGVRSNRRFDLQMQHRKNLELQTE